MAKLMDFFKNETVFSISLILAVISCFFVKPSGNYLKYINSKKYLDLTNNYNILLYTNYAMPFIKNSNSKNTNHYIVEKVFSALRYMKIFMHIGLTKKHVPSFF